MNGWLMIWILFAAGLFPLGLGIWIFTNPKLRGQKEQRKVGIVAIIVGLVLLSPLLWVLIPFLLNTRRI